ncbi:M42 family metallopeptidase [soil metagenome]
MERKYSMDDRNLTFLRELLDSPGPSGFETRPAEVWRSAASSIADSVDRDVLGNSYARLANPGKPVAVIEGHIDEIGLMITHVDEQGYVWFDRIGGWDIQILLGQRVIVLGTHGDVVGVIGRQAAHLLKDSEREKAPQISDLWIDIGAADREAALAHVQVGDPAVLDLPFCQVSDDRIVSRSIDNRVGAYVALRSLQILAKSRPTGVEVVALAATQEETSFAGASTATFSLQPAVGVVFDVTHATDYPSADKRHDGEISIGGGPVLSRGPSLNPIAFEIIRDIARAQ